MKLITSLQEKIPQKYQLGILLASIVLLGIYAYGDLSKNYFQQDEWHTFGWALSNNYNFWTVFKENWFDYLLGIGRPLASFLGFNSFRLFGLNASSFGLISMVVHIINALLLFSFVVLLTKSKKIAFLAAVFFITNSVHHQAITWFGTIMSTLTECFFTLLSLNFFALYILKKKRTWFFLSFVSVLIAGLFRESAVILFLLIPLMGIIVFNNGARNWGKLIKEYAIFFVGGFLFAVRFLPSFFKDTHFGNQGPTLAGSDPVYELVYRAIFYPLESLSQIFLYPPIIYKWTDKLLSVIFPYFAGNDLVKQTIASEYVTVIASFVILSVLLVIYLYALRNKEKERKLLIMATCFVLLSALPFIFYGRGTAFLESRYRYITSIGAGLLFSIVIFALLSAVGRIEKSFIKKICYVLVISGVLFYINMQVGFIKKDLYSDYQTGSQRKEIFTKVTEKVPRLSAKSVFYTESDYYYDSVHHILPLQSGFGEMLMVNYVSKKQLNPRFLDDDFLWGIFSEGYKEIDGQGFGHFNNFDLLQNSLQKYAIPLENVYAFRWGKGILSDISIETRTKLKKTID